MTELAPEKNLPEAPSSLAGGYRAMDEYVKWSVGPFWQQILGSTKQASFIKRAGEPRSEQVWPSNMSNCVLCQNVWILRNLADPSCDMLRVCTVFHALRFLQMNHRLSLLLFLLVLSVLTRFAVMEHAKLEQIDFGATVHTSFDPPKR